MKDSPRAWVVALAVWAFMLFWIAGFSGGLFASACNKPDLTSEQRLFRCGWAWTLTAPVRLMGDPPARYAAGQMTMGIAHADMGNQAAAVAAFALTLSLSGLTPPVDPQRDLAARPETTRQLFDRALALPPESDASKLFFRVAAGQHH